MFPPGLDTVLILHTSAGRLTFFRSYTSSGDTWQYKTTWPPELAGVPKPFGGNPAGFDLGNGDLTLRWWHNYFAFVTQIPFHTGEIGWGLRDQYGSLLLYHSGCGASVSQPCGCS